MPPRPAENTYFPVDLFRPLANECILDCGAYIGDTVGQILGVCGETFAAIYPFEGDAVSFGKLSEYVASLGDEVSRRIHPIHGAIGGARGVVRFGGDGGTGSAMNAGDGVDVQCYPLDELSFAAPVTIIKMDIEGAEYEALHGARETIARDRPLLAICVYHTQCDLWRIPLLVHSMLPDHRLFLRAYEGDGFQTVLYAVPPARLLPDAGRASTHGG
jgi:FkbM family methyltransferase